jgi:hypothetical protein
MPNPRVELPLREFMYTLDQLGMLLGVPETVIRKQYIFFDGVTTGTYRGRMRARNIAPDHAPPDWRVNETQFRNYLRRRGYTVVEPHLLG